MCDRRSRLADGSVALGWSLVTKEYDTWYQCGTRLHTHLILGRSFMPSPTRALGWPFWLNSGPRTVHRPPPLR